MTPAKQLRPRHLTSKPSTLKGLAMIGHQGLKNIDNPVYQAAADTYVGMAFGPKGRECFGCRYFGAGHRSRPTKASIKSGCHKWVEMTKRIAKRFPGEAKACRYFESFLTNTNSRKPI